MKDKKYPKFGTDGIRGKAGLELTPSLITRLGYVAGKTLKTSGPILIGNDTRRSCSMIVSALTAGLNSAGREVWRLGLCPTPAISILTRKFNIAGGIMVSASHNPPEDNGIKIFNENGNKLNTFNQSLITLGIEEMMTEDIQPAIYNNYGNSYDRNELLVHYKENLIESINEKNLKNIPIILDLCYGSATAVGEEVFKQLGAKVTAINNYPNGNHINVNCGSTNLNQLRKAVIEQHAEMGFAFDGDADRMMAIDRKGRVIDGDHVLYLWGKVLKEQDQLPQKRLVGTVMSNLGFEKDWNNNGGILERTQVGDQNVHAEIIEKGATLGGEQSGHILSATNGFCGDGVHTALQIATICHSKEITLSEWRDESFKPFSQKMINVRLNENSSPYNLLKSTKLQDAIAKAEDYIGKNGRVIVRASGTEPLIRVMVESPEEEITNNWCLLISQEVNKLVQ